VVVKRPITEHLLRRAPLFADLPSHLLIEVARNARPLFRPKGARIFEEGTVADCCYLLTDGRVKVVLAGTSDGQITLNVLEPVCMIGEISLLDSMTRSAGLVAMEDSHLVQISKASFLELRNNRSFEDKLVIHVAATLRSATEQLRAIYTFDSMERVAWCMARLARPLAGRNEGEIVISPRPTHHEVAEMTGCSRETVSRALLRLRRMGWMRWDDSSLYLDERSFGRYLNPGQHAERS
jgi:CRP/FNR family transcriptional regulator, cyclic AMP receptor protein